MRRETEYHGLQAKLDRLNVAQMGLVFGRIDIDAPGDNPTSEGLIAATSAAWDSMRVKMTIARSF